MPLQAQAGKHTQVSPCCTWDGLESSPKLDILPSLLCSTVSEGISAVEAKHGQLRRHLGISCQATAEQEAPPAPPVMHNGTVDYYELLGVSVQFRSSCQGWEQGWPPSSRRPYTTFTTLVL